MYNMNVCVVIPVDGEPAKEEKKNKIEHYFAHYHTDITVWKSMKAYGNMANFENKNSEFFIFFIFFYFLSLYLMRRLTSSHNTFGWMLVVWRLRLPKLRAPL